MFSRRSAVKTVALGVVFVLATALMDTQGGLGPAEWLQVPARVLLNALPGLLLAALLLALTRRAVLSMVLVLLLEALLYGVNALKMQNLGTPLLPADFYMIRQLSHGVSKLFEGYLPKNVWFYAGLAGLLVAVVLLACLERPALRRGWRSGRASLALVSVLALATLLAGITPWPHVYDDRRMRMQPWSPTYTARESGLVTGLMLFYLHFGPQNQKPDMTAVRHVLAREGAALKDYMQQPTAAGPQPDIVVIQSESFFDPVIMNGYENAGLNPNLHRLARQGTSGFMHVPTFGGGTIRTEFEVLTGMPLRYLAGVQFPYLQLGQRTIPSLVHTLQTHGYRSVAVHGSDPKTWDRERAFRRMGFDRFVSIDDFPADARIDGRYMADSAMTDEILAQLDNDASPQFIFAISIEAHGSYDVSPGIDPAVRDAVPVPASVTDPGARRELQHYIYHMRHADEELGRLVAALRKRERPTLVVFYGDHLPGLLGAFKQAGFVDGRDHREQMVPWLMIETHVSEQPRQQTTTAWMLPGMILDRVGIRDARYFALTQLLGPALVSLDEQTDTPVAGPGEDEKQKLYDKGMANLAKLRLRDGLDSLTASSDDSSESDGTLTTYGHGPRQGVMRYGTAP